MLRSVCIVLYGLGQHNQRLQPWRYVTEIAIQLAQQGHRVHLLTEDAPPQLPGVSLRRLRSVRNFICTPNRELQDTIAALAPDILVWSVGLTSFLHQDYNIWKQTPQVGLFSSPIYSPRELLRLGPRLGSNYPLTAIHLLGTFSPRSLLRWRAARMGLARFVTQTQTTRQALQSLLGNSQVTTITPGVDPFWAQPPVTSRETVRAALGFMEADFVVAYLGSPASLRGLPVLLRALALARQSEPRLRLLVLNRRNPSELERESRVMEATIRQFGLQQACKVVTGFIQPAGLVEAIGACDLVALPFELLPSDAPLSVLEVLAAGKPLVTTRLACLPELSAGGRVCLVEPGNALALAQAILDQAKAAPVNAVAHKPRSWQAVGEEWSKLVESL